MLWLVLCIIVISITVFLSSRVYVTCTYRYSSSKQFFNIKIHMFKLRLYEKTTEMNPTETKDFWTRIEKMGAWSNVTRKKIRLTFHLVRNVKDMMKIILQSMSVHEMRWHTAIGMKDASLTGVMTGVAWTVKGMTVGTIDHVSDLKCIPDISIVPHFQQSVIQSEINCMISIKLGNAIYRAFQLMQKLSSQKKYIHDV